MSTLVDEGDGGNMSDLGPDTNLPIGSPRLVARALSVEDEREEIPPRTGFRWQVVLIIVLLSIWEGFPFQPLGIPPSRGYQLYTLLVVLGCVWRLYDVVRRNSLVFSWWEATPLILATWCTLVSFYWSSVLQGVPLDGWLVGFPIVAPLLTIFLLNAVGATRRDAVNGLYGAAIFGSLLVAFDTLTKFGLLAAYSRGSAFTEGHIVFFKMVTAFGVVIGITRTINATKLGSVLLNLTCVALTGYNVLVLMESRLVSIAIFLAFPIIWLLAVRGLRKVFSGLLAPLAFGPVIVYFVASYLGNIQSLAEYLKQDRSAQFRLTEHEYFKQIFEQSYGMGFGYMSDSDRFDNVVTFAANRAGYLVGTGDYGMSIVDIGLPSALFQFGYVGLALVLVMTAVCIGQLLWSARGGSDYAETVAAGALMATLMISPISTNFFTLSYTAHIGGLLWFLASRAARDRAGQQLLPAEPRQRIRPQDLRPQDQREPA